MRGLPSVFDVAAKPWIDVNGAAPEAIMGQVKLCPSGALSYELLKKGDFVVVSIIWADELGWIGRKRAKFDATTVLLKILATLPYIL